LCENFEKERRKNAHVLLLLDQNHDYSPREYDSGRAAFGAQGNLADEEFVFNESLARNVCISGFVGASNFKGNVKAVLFLCFAHLALFRI
jgi:hypothetical protein